MKNKTKKYLLTKILLIIGFILGLILFFNSKTIWLYLEFVVAFTLFIGSIGFIIERFKMKKPLIPMILIIVYLLIGGFIINEEQSNGITCQSCNFEPYRNILTGNCRTICDICGHSPAWYYEKDEECRGEIPFYSLLKDLENNYSSQNINSTEDVIYLD